MAKSQRMCNGKVAVNAGKCDKVVKLVQRCNIPDSSSRPFRLYRIARWSKQIGSRGLLFAHQVKDELRGARCRVKAKSFNA